MWYSHAFLHPNKQKWIEHVSLNEPISEAFWYLSIAQVHRAANDQQNMNNYL